MCHPTASGEGPLTLCLVCFSCGTTAHIPAQDWHSCKKDMQEVACVCSISLHAPRQWKIKPLHSCSCCALHPPQLYAHPQIST